MLLSLAAVPAGAHASAAVVWKRVRDLAASLMAACFSSHDPGFRPADAVGFTNWVDLYVDTSTVAAEVEDRYLSVAIDIANVVGGEFWDPAGNAPVMGMAKVARYDFSRPQLQRLAAALGPAFLRIGGTDADRTIYDLDGRSDSPVPGAWRLQREQWDALNRFALAANFRLIFTLNAGLTARGPSGRWDPASARALLEDTQARKYPVEVWELGNELNVYPLLHQHWLSPEAYAEDVQLARWLVDEVTPQAKLAGPAVAFWPLLGEGIPFSKSFMRSGGRLLDVVTWHYYPQQSFRCPVATNRAHAGEVLGLRALGEIERWAQFVEQLSKREAPQAQVWLGETGGAQCGGEPEHSDRFASSLWWVDQLGRVARRGQRVMVRQTLSGGNYGLIDDETLNPNPDYWASLLWRRLMGTRVLAVSSTPGAAFLAYAHCHPALKGAVTLALINVDPLQSVVVNVGALGLRAEAYLVQAEGPQAATVTLNGQRLQLSSTGQLPELAPQTQVMHRHGEVQLLLPSQSYAFLVLPAARASACLEGIGEP